jgi:hypothetical protein
MLGFTPKVKTVEIKPDGFVEELLLRATKINNMESAPDGVRGCENCCKLEELINVAVY